MSCLPLVLALQDTSDGAAVCGLLVLFIAFVVIFLILGFFWSLVSK
mgnify:CR=1 FL=1